MKIRKQLWSHQVKRYLRIIFLACLGLVTALCLPVFSLQGEVTPQPVNLAQQGKNFYEAGELDRAIATWQEAADAYAAAGNSQGSMGSLMNTATAQQALGLYPQSCQTVLQAFAVDQFNCLELQQQAQSVEQKLSLEADLLDREQSKQEVQAIIKPIVEQPDSLNKATGLLRLGDYLRETGYAHVAESVLSFSLDTAKTMESPVETTAALLSLGNTARAIADREQNRFPPLTVALDVVVNQRGSATAALEPYQSAIDYYQQAAQVSTSNLNGLRAELNHLSLLIDSWEFWQQATTELQNNTDELGITDESFLAQIRTGAVELHDRIAKELQPQIATLTQQIQPQIDNLPVSRAGVFSRINYAQSLIRQGIVDTDTAQILAVAAKDARQINNNSAEAEALGYLGQLYEKQQKYPEAKKLTEQAIQLVPTADYPEIAYRWHRQLGRILNLQNDRSGAIAAYEASFNTIKALRTDLATTPVEPIFREFVSILLKEEPTQAELNKARDVLESLQIAELDNFFRDPCSEVAEEPVIIDRVDEQAAVIYPIILDNRLEVIATIPGQDLRRYYTDISQEDIQLTIKQLRNRAFLDPGVAEQVRSTRGSAQQRGQLQQIETNLNQSLDREILPLAGTIYDWLIRPIEADLAKNKVTTLVFVLDGSMRNIPMAMLYDREQKMYLIEKDYNIAVSSGLQLTNPQPLARQPIKVLAAGVTKEIPELDLPPIPKVEDELKLIKTIFKDSEILLNNQFTKANFQKRLQESDFPVVHLATHGQFSSTSDQTFIISGDPTGDQLINVKQLDNLLKVGSLRRTKPIELLVLSACNTAEGDNQAVLGLAGVAVRAGARSTLATLWGANDEATAELMGYFYQNLASDIQVNKAQALRQAQLALLKTPDSQYRHPYYWAPFVLVGNWL
jgi:CHAT domain-containing protein